MEHAEVDRPEAPHTPPDRVGLPDLHPRERMPGHGPARRAADRRVVGSHGDHEPQHRGPGGRRTVVARHREEGEGGARPGDGAHRTVRDAPDHAQPARVRTPKRALEIEGRVEVVVHEERERHAHGLGARDRAPRVGKTPRGFRDLGRRPSATDPARETQEGTPPERRLRVSEEEPSEHGSDRREPPEVDVRRGRPCADFRPAAQQRGPAARAEHQLGAGGVGAPRLDVHHQGIGRGRGHDLRRLHPGPHGLGPSARAHDTPPWSRVSKPPASVVRLFIPLPSSPSLRTVS